MPPSLQFLIAATILCVRCFVTASRGFGIVRFDVLAADEEHDRQGQHGQYGDNRERVRMIRGRHTGDQGKVPQAVHHGGYQQAPGTSPNDVQEVAGHDGAEHLEKSFGAFGEQVGRVRQPEDDGAPQGNFLFGEAVAAEAGDSDSSEHRLLGEADEKASKKKECNEREVLVGETWVVGDHSDRNDHHDRYDDQPALYRSVVDPHRTPPSQACDCPVCEDEGRSDRHDERTPQLVDVGRGCVADFFVSGQQEP